MTNQTKTGLRYSKDNWFTCIDAKVLCDEYLLPSEKLIFVVLCMIASFGYRTCSPSIDEVAEISGFSVRTVRRAYKELEARGVIARESRFKNGQQTSSYTLILGHNAPCYGGVIYGGVGVSSMTDRTRYKSFSNEGSQTPRLRRITYTPRIRIPLRVIQPGRCPGDYALNCGISPTQDRP